MANSSFVELSSPHFHPAQTKADLVRVRFTQAHVASGWVGPLVDQLMQLSDSKEGVLRWKDKLIIGVEKLPTETRDASEIPVMVDFFRQLTRQWPFWMHFVEKESGTMGAVLRLLIGTERLPQPNGRASLVLTDADAVRTQSKWLYNQMKYLYRCHGLPETDDTEMAQSIARAVNAMFQRS